MKFKFTIHETTLVKNYQKIITSQTPQVLCLSSMDFTNVSKFEGGARSPIHYLYLFNVIKNSTAFKFKVYSLAYHDLLVSAASQPDLTCRINPNEQASCDDKPPTFILKREWAILKRHWDAKQTFKLALQDSGSSKNMPHNKPLIWIQLATDPTWNQCSCGYGKCAGRRLNGGDERNEQRFLYLGPASIVHMRSKL